MRIGRVFLALMQTDDIIAEGFGGPSASNFASRSGRRKKIVLKWLVNTNHLLKGFLEYSTVPIEKHLETKLLSEDRKAIFELAISSSKNMRYFGQSRGAAFVELESEDQRLTLQLADLIPSIFGSRNGGN